MAFKAIKARIQGGNNGCRLMERGGGGHGGSSAAAQPKVGDEAEILGYLGRARACGLKVQVDQA
jgi:hypothetical protein